MQPLLTLILPAHNELSILPTSLHRLKSEFSKSDFTTEIVVVNDGSTDGTSSITFDSLADAHFMIKLINHAGQLGKGCAIRTGMRSSSASIIGFTDADLPIAPSEVVRVAEIALSGQFDLIVGKRIIIDEARAGPYRSARRAAGLMVREYARCRYGYEVSDVQCPLKFFANSDLIRTVLQACSVSGYLADVELIRVAIRRGYQIYETPVFWRDLRIAPSSRQIVNQLRSLGTDARELRRR